MRDPQERESALAARCSRYAAEYLCQFRVHPLYPEVLSRLESLPGTIYALDIEHVFLEAIKQKASRAERNARQVGAIRMQYAVGERGSNSDRR